MPEMSTSMTGSIVSLIVRNRDNIIIPPLFAGQYVIDNSRSMSLNQWLPPYEREQNRLKTMAEPREDSGETADERRVRDERRSCDEGTPPVMSQDRVITGYLFATCGRTASICARPIEPHTIHALSRTRCDREHDAGEANLVT